MNLPNLKRMSGLTLLSLLILLTALWAVGALYYRLPGGAPWREVTALVWGMFTLGVIVACWQDRLPPALAAYCAAFLILTVWWQSIRPSNERAWTPDVARIVRAEIQGSRVTLHNVRNFNWRTDEDFDEHWETREIDLDRLRSVDVALSYWMGPAIAHTLVSFGYDRDDGRRDHIVFSIEIRKEKGEAFSAVAGFFKQYELALIAADERDILRVRTNVRGEDDHLYGLAIPVETARSMLLGYVGQAQALTHSPRFYDTLFANCTTIVYEMARRIEPGLPMDWRLLASGYLPGYLDKLGVLAPGFSLKQLIELGHFTARALASDRTDFPQAIRAGMPVVPLGPPADPAAGHDGRRQTPVAMAGSPGLPPRPREITDR